jgi:hypothetical protein
MYCPETGVACFRGLWRPVVGLGWFGLASLLGCRLAFGAI